MVTTGLINNAVNFVYYTWISDGVSDLNSSSYNIGDSEFRYLTRWDRLDYAKQQVKSMYGENASSFFDLKAWMYYNEYNFHMYAWAVLKRFHGEYNLLGSLAEAAKEASVDPLWEDDLIRYPFYILIGLLGM